MPRAMPLLARCLLVSSVVVVGTTAAQARFAFDSTRGQIVYASAGLEAFDGSTWHWIGGSATGGPPMMVFDTVRSRWMVVEQTRALAWNGARWEFAGSLRPELFTPALAWDTARDRLVAVTQAGTFEWDGNTVTGPFPQPFPPLSYSAVSFDPATGRVLVQTGGALRETWLWTGGAWTLAAAGSGPTESIRYQAGDPVRGRTVAVTRTGETWEWNGASWTLAGRAPPDAQHAMGLVFDPTRRECLLIGQVPISFDVLAWNGTAWRETVQTRPPSFTWAGAVYDAARDDLVVFGGESIFGISPRRHFDQTWLWQGTRWTRASPATTPPARSRHAMTWDAARQEVVLFGGLGTNVWLGDTWIWNGADWRLASTTGPSAREGAAMTGQSAFGTCLLFGGSNGGSPPDRDDTWQWNGSAWSRLAPAQSPPRRRDAGLAHDPGRGITLLAGGTSGGSGRDDTWEWNGVDWRVRSGLPAGYGPSMKLVFHSRRARVLAGANYPHSLVEWDGAAWVPSPVRDPWGNLGFDSRRGSLVSLRGPGACFYPEAPRVSVRSIEYPTGGGCRDGAGFPALATFGVPAMRNASFAIEAACSGPVPILLGVAATTAAPPVPVPGGCEWQLGPALFAPAVASPIGRAAWRLPVPDLLGLLGTALHVQAVAPDPSAAAGIRLTDRLEMLVGAW